jgi:hypothetical protein
MAPCLWRSYLEVRPHTGRISFPDLSEMEPIDQDVRRKAVLFLLAAACGFFAGAGLQLLLLGESPLDAVHGGGSLLLWGSAAAALLARVHGHSLPGISLAIWTGAGLVLASWF